MTDLFLPGAVFYRRNRPVLACLMAFLFLADGLGLFLYYQSQRTTLSMVRFGSEGDVTPRFMGLIPRVEETYLVFNPTETGFDIRRATPIWPGNRFIPYPGFGTLAVLYHILAVVLLALHLGASLRWRKAP